MTNKDRLESQARYLREHPYAGDPGDCDRIADEIEALEALEALEDRRNAERAAVIARSKRLAEAARLQRIADREGVING